MRWLKRNWQRLLLGLALIIGVALALIFWPITENLSALKQRSAQYTTRILRDAWGVPHIFGQTDADAAYGLAYAHAEDDFLTIQKALLAVRGQLASVDGADAAPLDYVVQLLRVWDTVHAKYATDLQPETRAILEAYADGLNVYAATHPRETLPGLFPVTGPDIVAESVFEAPLLFAGLQGTLEELYQDTRQVELSLFPTATAAPPNSNVFAVAPGRTANGETFLAVNSHQPWTGIAAWYEVHLHSEEGWDMAGSLFPGSPVVIGLGLHRQSS
jgi:acyl-homoserine-lactone acylase